jgi:hypothetical protein
MDKNIEEMKQKCIERCSAPVFENWKFENFWKVFSFNFNGAETPKMGELSLIQNTVFRVTRQSNVILYMFADEQKADDKGFCDIVEEPVLFLMLSTVNSAHSICELISFLKFEADFNPKLKIAVNSIIVEHLPFLYKLLLLFLGVERIIIIYSDRNYFIREAWLRRETHFNYVINWTEVDFIQMNDVLTFNNLSSKLRFVDDPEFLFDKVKIVYEQNRSNFELFDRVMLIKTADDKLTTTPSRAMNLSQALRLKLESAKIKVVSVDSFKSIEEYICTLYHATTFVTSYGGAACTNRFFLRPSCDVLLLANRKYEWEYHMVSPGGEFWHIRHSHLFPVERQRIILDQPDVLTDQCVDRILSMSAAL